MATAEKSGPLKYKNQSGDVTIFYPVTLKENVTGMEGIDAHLVDKNNPHQVTAEQVGADASGSAAAVQTKLDTHTANKNNPHQVTAEQIGADASGSAAAVQTKLDTHTANKNNPHQVTAEQVGADASGSAAAVQTKLDAHTANKNNPHKVTAEQIGALSGIVPLTNGGTGATDGATGLKNLFAAGTTVLSSNQYGDTLPDASTVGQLFFKKGESVAKPVTMDSTDGRTYTCTVPGITELTAGVSFIGIPSIESTNKTVSVNVNGLGKKLIRRRVSNRSGLSTIGGSNNWLTSGSPLEFIYNGTCWLVADMTEPHAEDLMGSVPIANGGTGASDGATGLANLFAAGSTVLSSNQYGDTLPDAGTAGRLFFKKGNAAAKSIKVSETISSTGWSNKTYTINNSNITATNVIELLPRENNGTTQAQMEVLSGAMIIGGTQAVGSIQLVALGDVPTIDIPVTLIIRSDL